MRFLSSIILLVGMAVSTLAMAAPGSRNGEIQAQHGELRAWDTASQQWLMPVDFWYNYAAQNSARNWERSATFPPYEQVQEHDTFMAETESGPCLMEFFHSRWRRANDVRRWDSQFNTYAGCGRIFE